VRITKTRSRKAHDIVTFLLKIIRYEAFSISFFYAVFGALWILLSDVALWVVLGDSEKYKQYQTYKGWLYILITTAMVFLLVHKRMVIILSENRKKEEAYQRLQEAHTKQLEIEAELLFQKKLTDQIISEAPVFIVTHDEKRILSFNPCAQRVSGYSEEELLDKNWMELMVSQEYRSTIQRGFIEMRQGKKLHNSEFPIIAKDGTLLNILWNSNLVTESNNNGSNYFVSFGVDISERKHYEEEIERLAFYDRLTGLPNRVMFEKEIYRHINQNSNNSFMIAYIDIDNFKAINDSIGHQAGDIFLTYIAEGLKLEIKEPNIVARLGGDEFAILFIGNSRDGMNELLKAVRTRISRTWSIDNYQFFISMSVGVVAYPQDGRDTTMLLKNADIAMYEAKKEGKNRVLFYQKNFLDQNFRHMNMINNLQYGLEEKQFLLYYQPQYDLQDGKIIGLEALIRWIHPTDGFISPGEFIPVAEDSGQIFRLEQWIVTKALEQKKILESMDYKDIVMSINLSGKSLTSTVNFPKIEQIFADAKVDYSKVVVEITETANISDVGIVIEHLKCLKKLGVRVALDDFGTGYSSLNYLKIFPINIIKLDKSFINAINDGGIDTLLIKNILTLAHDLSYEVVAEGIETNEQLEYLRGHRCEAGQGYLLGRPAPEEKIYELLHKQYHMV
jgi:diguanylate cyclase (GGDEF)-like protein/PAS domain S-box-containing protein